MDKVTFYPLTEWAILPEKEEVNLSSENFSEIRWFHKKRKKELAYHTNLPRN